MADIYKFFYDVETTGVDFRKHSIIQFSAQIEKNDEVIEKINLFSKPHPRAIIDPMALKVNNLTEEQIFNFEHDYVSLYKTILKILGKYIDRFNSKQKMYLVGYNNRSFDDHFFRKLFELNNDSFFNSWFWSDSIDVMSAAADYLIDRRPYMTNFKLKTVAKELGLKVDESRLHDADYDIELTRQIYRICTKREAEPNDLYFFYYHDGSDSVWKSLTEEIDLDPGVEQISVEEYRAYLKRRGFRDGPEFEIVDPLS